ncbi:retrovirus-related Pol polyprotein from transposon TNT 1-94, partial [Trifolium medium]|nr:retrovirus-related Pol polyprotein from transposon TNT 1-94 [Trifolium medium]
MNVVIRVLKYIKGAPGKNLIYEDKGHTRIVGYSDANWTGSPIDRQSTSGTMALVACELIWLKQLFKELQFEEAPPIALICDNQAALDIASN